MRSKNISNDTDDAPVESSLQVYDAESYAELPENIRILWSSFLRAYKIVTEIIDKDLIVGGDISLADFEILYVIDRQGGRARFKYLQSVANLSSSTVSRRVATLREKGLVSRESTETDRRATFAVLTDKGRSVFRDAQAPFLESLQGNFLDRIPATNVAAVSATMLRLAGDSPRRKS